jgi:hypothetical protein
MQVLTRLPVSVSQAFPSLDLLGNNFHSLRGNHLYLVVARHSLTFVDVDAPGTLHPKQA